MKYPHHGLLTIISIATVVAAGDQTYGLRFQETLAEHLITRRGYGTRF